MLEIHYYATFWSSLISTFKICYIVQNGRSAVIFTTKSYHVSLNLTNLIESHQISKNLIKSCQISQYLTESHHILLSLTESHQISQNHTIAHQILQNLTISIGIAPHLTIFHKISPYLTESCKISLNLTKSKCRSRTSCGTILWVGRFFPPRA